MMRLQMKDVHFRSILQISISFLLNVLGARSYHLLSMLRSQINAYFELVACLQQPIFTRVFHLILWNEVHACDKLNGDEVFLLASAL